MCIPVVRNCMMIFHHTYQGTDQKKREIFIIKAPLTGSSLKEFEWEEKEEDFANINLKKI